MAEFLKNNPIALRHCLLYIFLQEKSVDEAFDGFCETVGNDVIKKEEFQYWFGQFKKGKFDDEEQPVTDMREYIRNDKNALRVCVLYEWLATKNEDVVEMLKYLLIKGESPPFTNYKNFCNVFGDNVMKFSEFEFWFDRFKNGEFDLDFETDNDKKIYKLTDMPIDIMKDIVEYLDIYDRASLIKTSRSFKTFVVDQKSFPKRLGWRLDSETADISFENRRIVTTESGGDCYRNSMQYYSENKRLINGVSHWEQGIQDLWSILEYPKLQLETFVFSLRIPRDFKRPASWEFEELDMATQIVEAAFMPFQHLSVKKLLCHSYNMNPLLSILPSLKPGYLSTIETQISKPDGETMKKIVELEQWKQAKYFIMNCIYNEYGFYIGPLCHLYHFKEFHVRLEQLSVEDIRQMIEVLFISPDFEKCTIETYRPFDSNTIKHEFGFPDHDLMSNSTQYFEIVTSFLLNPKIEITRKKK